MDIKNNRMLKLRDYQQDMVDAGINYLKGKSRSGGLLVAPCGSGKSLIIAGIANALKEPLLVLQPSKELLIQNTGKLIAMGGSPTIFSASCNKKELSSLTYATIKSVKKVTDELKSYGVRHVIIDEADMGIPPSNEDNPSEWEIFYKEMGFKKVLGLTASPVKMQQYTPMAGSAYSQLNMLNRIQGKTFSNILHVIQNKDVIDRGFWAPLLYETWEFDEGELKINKIGSEYTEDSIKRFITHHKINNLICERVIKLAEAKKSILVFMDSVKSCNTMCKYLNEKRGIKSVVVDAGMTGGARDRAVSSFKSGEIQVALCYATLGVGFDHPALDCIVIGRPTFSIRVFYQYVGRLVRKDPGNPDKEGLVVDCCGNYGRFGRIEDLSVEDFAGYGWGMFSGDRLVTGVPMGQYMDRRMLIEKYGEVKSYPKREKKPVQMNNPEAYMIESGFYKGKTLRDVPKEYLKFVTSSLPEGMININIKKYIKNNGGKI